MTRASIGRGWGPPRAARALAGVLTATLSLGVAVPALEARASVEVDGQQLEVVDMHLHPGDWSQMNPGGKAFIAGTVPIFLRGYAPAILGRALSPYGDGLGIAAETEAAGVDHALLYAVYTHHTTGYFTNEQLFETLDDPRNAGWAWGLVSLNLDELAPGLLDPRIEAMASYLRARPELFIGIKLAHAHQSVTLDDEAAFGIYEVAAELGAPVLLHTGFSPFPGTEDEAPYYDPAYLEDLVTLYDGSGEAPRVDFVFSHVGQGDARAVAAALDLAEAHENVWLEISALGRPLLIDETGAPVETGEDQYPFVLQAIRARGLVDRTLYASDGPQLSGNTRLYLQRMIAGMQSAGYGTDEIAAVLAGNFYQLYFDGDHP